MSPQFSNKLARKVLLVLICGIFLLLAGSSYFFVPGLAEYIKGISVAKDSRQEPAAEKVAAEPPYDREFFEKPALPVKTDAEDAAYSTSVATSSSARAVHPVRVAQVVFRPFATTTTYPAHVKASQTAKLAFRVGGPLIEIAAKPGERVKKGDVIMRIDPRDFKNQLAAGVAMLDAANAKLAAMRKGARDEDVKALEEQVKAAAAKQEFATTNFQRVAGLFKQNAVSDTIFEDAKMTKAAADAALSAQQQSLIKAKAGARVEEIMAAQAEIRGLETKIRVSKDQLEDTELRAPFDGAIIKQFVENYEMVVPGEQVVSLHDVSKLEIVADLPEKVVGNYLPNSMKPSSAPSTLPPSLQPNATPPVSTENPRAEKSWQGIPVEVKFSIAGNRSFTAKLVEINTEANPQTRTYELTFLMDAPRDLILFPGMTCRIVVSHGTQGLTPKPVMAIPYDAVVSRPGGKRYVVKVGAKNKALFAPIKLGRLLANNYCEVLAGVKEGELVVTDGAPTLSEGDTLQIMK